MSIEFVGLEGVLKEFEGVSNPKGNPYKAMMRACLKVEDTAKELAPKGKTGDLGRFISSRVEMDGTELLGVVFNPLEYAPYVEYGTGLFAEFGGRTDVPWCYFDEETEDFIWTKGQQPHPFMRPALDMNREEVVRIFREGLLNG